jgi:hypothetical protein
MKQSPEWNKAALWESPLFAPLHPILADFGGDVFPDLQDCNKLLAAVNPPITVQNGMPLRFVPQECGKLSFEAQYEPRCYLTGEVQMRAHDWHDLFNALVWLTFPKTKAAINERHYRALAQQKKLANSGRGTVRDVNTLLDESGVLIVYADADLAGLLRDFKWKELFWQRRAQVRTNMGFYLFGHGLYEKALRPYIGMTGQGLLMAVKPEFFSWTPARQLIQLDSMLADYLAMPAHCCSTRELSPLPLLGIPGWAADNDSTTYYDNTGYFRPGRRT